jgi:hypothetical protein
MVEATIEDLAITTRSSRVTIGDVQLWDKGWLLR